MDKKEFGRVIFGMRSTNPELRAAQPYLVAATISAVIVSAFPAGYALLFWSEFRGRWGLGGLFMVLTTIPLMTLATRAATLFFFFRRREKLREWDERAQKFYIRLGIVGFIFCGILAVYLRDSFYATAALAYLASLVWYLGSRSRKSHWLGLFDLTLALACVGFLASSHNPSAAMFGLLCALSGGMLLGRASAKSPNG